MLYYILVGLGGQQNWQSRAYRRGLFKRQGRRKSDAFMMYVRANREDGERLSQPLLTQNAKARVFSQVEENNVGRRKSKK